MTSTATTLPLPRVDASRWAALAVVLIGTFVVVLDFFIVNVAMPALQTDLHASTGVVEWVVAGYGLTFATLLITAGRLGDRYGRRRMFALGMALFTVASAACGLATSPEFLIAARVAQGAAAALLSTNVLSLINVTYEGEDRVRALGAYGTVMGLAAAGGQLIGGVLVDAVGWRSIFLINVPIGIAALALTRRHVAESRVEQGGRTDLVGTALLTLALIDLVLPLVEGRQHGWPVWTWLCLGAAPITLALFAVHQRRLQARGGTPLVDPALFRDRSFTAGLATQLAFSSGLASFFLVFALYLQQGRGLDALEAGMVFTILAAAYLATSARTPRVGRVAPAAGAVAIGAGHALLALTVSAGGSIAALAPALLLIGAGMGLVMAPLTATVLAGVSTRHAGAASGVLATMQQIGNALGVAVTGVIFFGAADRGIGHAFELSLIQLAALSAVVAALTRLLPRAS